MSHPIRIEFPDVFYHVTSRGDRREDIFEGDQDRQAFLLILERVITQFNWTCYAWCLMDNHYHLLIQVPDGNLSKGMRRWPPSLICERLWQNSANRGGRWRQPWR